MKKTVQRLSMLFILVLLTGCGYTTRSMVYGDKKSICIEPFKNTIGYTAEQARNNYFPLLEGKITNAITDRFLFDGNLKIVKKENADLILSGELKNYQRDPLRYFDSGDVQEYRITITVSLRLWDPKAEKVVWQESGFGGDTTYFTSGELAKSESTALADALEDLARRVVERTVQDW